MPSIEGNKLMLILCQLYDLLRTDLYFVDRFADTLFQLKVSSQVLQNVGLGISLLSMSGLSGKVVTFIAISLKVYDQTVGKVLKEVREGGEGTTSESEKGTCNNFPFNNFKLKLNCNLSRIVLQK